MCREDISLFLRFSDWILVLFWELGEFFFFLIIINHFILYYLFILLFACIFYCLKIQCFSNNRNGERQLVWNPYLQGIRGGHDLMVVELISTFAMSVYSPLNIQYWCIDGKYRIYVARFRNEEKTSLSESFRPFRAELHKLYIYRQYTNILFILQ